MNRYRIDALNIQDPVPIESFSILEMVVYYRAGITFAEHAFLFILLIKGSISEG